MDNTDHLNDISSTLPETRSSLKDSATCPQAEPISSKRVLFNLPGLGLSDKSNEHGNGQSGFLKLSTDFEETSSHTSGMGTDVEIPLIVDNQSLFIPVGGDVELEKTPQGANAGAHSPVHDQTTQHRCSNFKGETEIFRGGIVLNSDKSTVETSEGTPPDMQPQARELCARQETTNADSTTTDAFGSINEDNSLYLERVNAKTDNGPNQLADSVNMEGDWRSEFTTTGGIRSNGLSNGLGTAEANKRELSHFQIPAGTSSVGHLAKMDEFNTLDPLSPSNGLQHTHTNGSSSTIQEEIGAFEASASDINDVHDQPQPDSAPATSNSVNVLQATLEPIKLNLSNDIGVTETNSAEVEYELDSSPIQSSSSDTSPVSSSSEDSDDDYEMLDPEEQARRLMQEDGGSDDEGGKKGANGVGNGPLRTLNEKPDELVEKPKVAVTIDMQIEELGDVETLVDNIVLIKAKTSGEYQVLETGSVLCLENRVVIGVVAETLGRVQQPLYSVRFTNASAIPEAGISIGSRLFYVKEHSTYVFTQPLKAFKGSDASNLHDEEVGDDELEFSDDDAEAEYKRKLKMQKQARRDGGLGLRTGISRGLGQGRFDKRRKNEDTPMNYDDTASISHDGHDDHDELYTPLARPANLHEMMGQREAPLESRGIHDDATRAGRGGRGRGRGDQARARGDRGRRGRGRGGDRGDRRGGGERAFQDRRNNDYQPPREPISRPVSLPPTSTMSSTDGFRSAYAASRYSSMGPPQSLTLSPSYIPQGLHFLPQEQNSPSPYAYGQMYPAPQYSTPHGYSPHAYANQQSPSHEFSHLEQRCTPQTQFSPPQQYLPHNLYHPPQPAPSLPGDQLPPGSFVNPAFFRNQPQHQHSPVQPSFPSLQPWMPQSQSSPLQQGGHGSELGQARLSVESDAAFRAAQDRLNVLRQLSKS